MMGDDRKERTMTPVNDGLTATDERLSNLNAALKVIGRLPRIVCGVQLAVFLLASVPAMDKYNPFLWVLLVAGVPMIAFILSLRIKAYATHEALIVRSYLRTYTARYDDVLGFSDVGYAGIWTTFNGTDSWQNLGLRVINVYSIRGRDLDLSATVMGRRSSKRIEELLNEWVPDEMPPDWKP